MWRQSLAGLRRAGGLLNRSRVLRYCALLLAIEAALALFIVAGTHGLVVPLDKPTSTDFVSFYAAGSLADAGTPELAYNQAAHHAAQQRATEPGIRYNFFYYPPVFLLLCAALAQLPYLVAFFAFEVATLVPFLIVATAIVGEWRWATLLPLLAFPEVIWNFSYGQNAFLTASLFGAGMLLLDRRPVIAGLLFGALCYKPQFGLLIPVALAAGGYWRAFAAAAASSIALVALSVLVFGLATWHAYWVSALMAHTNYECCVNPGGFTSPFGAVLVMGGKPVIAYAAQVAVTVAAIAGVAVVWRRRLPLELRAAALAAATLVAFPVVVHYDLLLGALAVAWLYRADGGLSPIEKLVVAVLFIASINPVPYGRALGVPMSGLIALAVIALVGGRISRAATGLPKAEAEAPA